MAEIYEVEVNGQIYEVEANHPQQAAMAARLVAAREQGTQQAEAGAQARLPEPIGETMRRREQELKTVNPERERELELKVREGEIQGVRKGLPALASVPIAGGLVMAPVATGTALLGGLVGSAVGGEAGKWVGHHLPVVGGETAGKVLGTVGGLAGGLVGGVKAPQIGGRKLLDFATGSRGGLLKALLGSGEAQATTAAREAAAAEAVTLRNELLKTRTKALEQKMGESLRKLAIAEAKEARLAKKAGLTIPEFRAATTAATPTAAPTAPILPEGQRAMPTNLGGVAKPGPTPTPPEDLEQVLRQSIEAAKAAKAAKAVSPLQAPRIQVGAQRVGRDVGLTKEEVRRQAGPVLDEVLGEASPILPQEPLKNIIDTMKALPKTGGAREAYVARATSGKAKWQVENIRRTLEHLGLLLPVGVAARMAKEK